MQEVETKRTCTVKYASFVWMVAHVSEDSANRWATVVQYLGVQLHERLMSGERHVSRNAKTSVRRGVAHFRFTARVELETSKFESLY